MEARTERRIKSGKEYEHLFPKPTFRDISVKKSAGLEDTMSLIQRTVPKTLWHTEKIAKLLKGEDLYTICSNIWHFVYNHIQYKKDEDGIEQVRSPRRTWWERFIGVDCDCYSEFISSILSNLKIPHVLRVTKYPKRPPETPRWQHVYPIVPKDGNAGGDLENRDDYIVLDCVKDDFDGEQPFLERKDYSMQLDYLDGLDNTPEEEDEYLLEYDLDTVDAQELMGLYEDHEDLGFLKKLVKKVGSAVKKTVKAVGKVAKKVADKVGDGIRIINRFVNPVTILLRNGFLLAMKVNLMNVAGRLRYAYLSDAQAKAIGINPDNLKKIRSVKDRAETVYWQAGGKKANLKKAILKGKGNKDKKVQVSGLDGLNDEYMDIQEYHIINSDRDQLEGLGIVESTALAAATGAVAAISAALKQIKGLFSKGGSEEQAFQSETDNAGSEASIPTSIPSSEEDEEKLMAQLIMEDNETPAKAQTPTNATSSSKSTLPASSSRSTPAAPGTENQSTAMQTTNNTPQAEGFIQKTTTWVKENPGKSLLIAGAAAGGGYLLIKALKGGNNRPSGNGLSGLPSPKKKKKKRKNRSALKKIQSIKL